LVQANKLKKKKKAGETRNEKRNWVSKNIARKRGEKKKTAICPTKPERVVVKRPLLKGGGTPNKPIQWKGGGA